MPWEISVVTIAFGKQLIHYQPTYQSSSTNQLPPLAFAFFKQTHLEEDEATLKTTLHGMPRE